MEVNELTGCKVAVLAGGWSDEREIRSARVVHAKRPC